MGQSKVHVIGAGALCALYLLLAAGCANEANFKLASDKPRATVCDPFGGGGGTEKIAIAGTIHYLDADQVAAGLGGQIANYLNLGHTFSDKIYMSSINIPTRPFESGFVLSDGTTLKNEAGEPLIEYFGLHLETQLVLGEQEPNGRYQLAILGDDGVVVNSVGAAPVELVNSDGVNMTKFKISQLALNMRKGKKIPIEINYFQGPKFHLSLILMWRLAPADMTDPADGTTGNDLFFDFNTTPSTPKQAYNDLLARGWAPLKSENYVLREGEAEPPPCQ